MSVATSNAFALLDDEGTVDVSALAARIPAAQKPAPKPVEETKPVARTNTREAPRGGGRGGFGGRGPRAPRANEEGGAFDAESAPALRSGGAGRGRGGRGGRGRGDSDRSGRREYDRHDGSGRGHETEKRSGGGRGNWGAEVEAAGEEPAERPPPPEPTPEEVEAAEAARREREEEERQLSLSAYEAQQAAKRASLNSAKGPTYVVDKDQFKGMKSFTKVEEDVGLDLHKNVKTIGANKGGRDKELKQKELVKDVGFRIAGDDAPRGPPAGGRGGRGGRFEGGRGGGRFEGGRGGGRFEGGRGGGRFEGGRGGGRFEGGRGGRGAAPRPAHQGASINVEDTAAFPSLA